MTKAERIAAMLNLKPLPMEGAFFTETYRCPGLIPAGALPAKYSGARSLCTAIYYLITPEAFSAMHRLLSDEIYHFYLGDPVDLLLLRPDGGFKVHSLGPDILGGMEPQVVVPAGVWQGSRLSPGGEFALVGTTVAPGFDSADYQHGRRNELLRLCPEARELISGLTEM
ncbi:MAG: cupin domain-containing protein [bacterium]